MGHKPWTPRFMYLFILLVLAYSPLDWTFPWWLWGIAITIFALNCIASDGPVV